MSTIDLKKVAGFKAVDAEGNDMGIVSLSEMTNMVKESIIQEAVAMQSVSTLAETSTLAATDTYEDQLPTSDTFSHVRTLDANGNPRLTSSQALATVVGGLIGTANDKQNGLQSKNGFFFRGNINAGDSIDTCVKAGWYYINNNNSVPGVSYGQLVVYNTGDCIRQTAFDEFSSLTKTRNKSSSGAWSQWG